MTGAILVAYPFSGRATAHRVRLDGREVYAMCAIDALGIAPMLGEPIEIASRDPLTGEDVQVALEPGGDGSWQPASSANAERWLGAHPEVQGTVISMAEAIVAGRAVFGDILKEA